MAIKMQFNESTGKASFKVATGKAQTVERCISDCYPATYELTISGVSTCSESPVSVSAVNDTWLLPYDNTLFSTCDWIYISGTSNEDVRVWMFYHSIGGTLSVTASVWSAGWRPVFTHVVVVDPCGSGVGSGSNQVDPEDCTPETILIGYGGSASWKPA